MQKSAIHLGDGAYASFDEYDDLFITANHHEPDQASDVVAISKEAKMRLIAFMKEVESAY